jgi:hypothetical protein
MPKFEAVVRYAVQGYQFDTLQVEASNQEEAEQKALCFDYWSVKRRTLKS